MARQRVYEYVFSPGTAGLGTVKIQGRVNLADLLAIYDTTRNVNIYNFADTTLGGTVSWTAGVTEDFPAGYDGVTTITLSADTSSCSASDKLAIYLEERWLEVQPWAFGQDAIGRERIANPEALIDADFEYGLQNTKWQNFSVNNNIPGFFEYTGADINVSTNGYVSFLAGDDLITSNVDTAVKLSNPGSPEWVANDFALIISQTQGNTTAFSSTYLTANVMSPQERLFTVSSTTGFSANDNVLIIPLPASVTTTVAVANVTSNATTSINVANASGIVDGCYIMVETNTANVFETMAVTNVSANVLTVLRQTNNTNGGSASINIGNDVYVVNDLEVAKVFEVTDSTTLQVQRGWYNIPSVQTANVGSIIQRCSSNVELVEHTAISTAVNGTQTISRSAYGSTALTAAGAGSLFVRMTGMYNASTNAEIPLVAVNAPDHGIGEGEGEFCTVINASTSNAEGINIVSALGYNTNNFSYYPHRDPALALGYTMNQTDTVVREAYAFTGADLDVLSITSDGGNPSIITVTTTYAHGLVPGTPILADISAGTNYTYALGSFLITSIPSTTTFTYQAKSGAAVSGSITGIINVRSNAIFLPRPFDGGVVLGPGIPTHGASATRQTKKYFRYQSGKGILFTTGTMLKPTFDITTLVADGTTVGSTITVTTDLENGLQKGARIDLSGIFTSGYEGNYVVTDILSDTSFTVTAAAVLGSTTPDLAPQPRVNVTNWHGSSIRTGIFDDQNGMYWECDGTNINAVQRSSTFQVAGLVSVGVGSNLVTGDTVCRFQDQLNNGDIVVIRGMTHTVTSILSQNRMTVVPAYRGVSNQNRVKMALRQEVRVHREDFNIDPLDGTGPSGFTLNASKMQMVGIEYSWYGAGYVQWMIRGQNGQMVPCHRRPNNNINNEAFMRSGNLPARYEAVNETPVNALDGAITNSQTTITLKDASEYPDASVAYPAFVMIDSEIIKYSGKSGNDLTGCTRGATFVQWIEGASRSFTSSAADSHADNTGVILISNTCTPLINHWGSSVIMDGNFDGDQGYQFTYSRVNYGLPGTVGQKQVAFAMRLAPSVSNGIIGELGERDLINRAQVTLKNMVFNVTAGRYLVEGILNPDNIDAANTSWTGLNNLGGGYQPSFCEFSTSPRYTSETTGGVTSSTYGSVGGFTKSGSKTVFSSSRTYANLTPTNISSSGSGANLTVQLTAAGSTYTNNTVQITVQNPGTGYAIGDTLKITGNVIGGSTPSNDLSLTVAAITTELSGGERLFAIPISTTNSGQLDLSSVKQIGTSAIPGTGIYPNGPEVLAIQLTALSTVTNPVGEVQVQYFESQA